MKKPADVMPAATARLFSELEAEPLLQSFILIGGTALALHIGHRISEDLDFIILSQKLPRAALDALTRKTHAGPVTPWRPMIVRNPSMNLKLPGWI